MLKLVHRQRWLKFAQYHKNWTVEDWKRVLWSYETKLDRIGSDESGSNGENQYLTGLQHQLSNMEEETILWYGVVWGGIGWGSL